MCAAPQMDCVAFPLVNQESGTTVGQVLAFHIGLAPAERLAVDTVV
jgi:hypothetical protein